MPDDGTHPALEVGEQQEELVPTLPRDQVRLARASAEPLGELLQELVAGVVAERVVHELEVVEVEVEHADAEVVPARPGDRRLEHLLEERPVRQAGELVVVREERHLLLGALALGDVEDHALDQPGLAGLVVDRVRLLEDPADVPSSWTIRYSWLRGSCALYACRYSSHARSMSSGCTWCRHA